MGGYEDLQGYIAFSMKEVAFLPGFLFIIFVYFSKHLSKYSLQMKLIPSLMLVATIIYTLPAYNPQSSQQPSPRLQETANKRLTQKSLENTHTPLCARTPGKQHHAICIGPPKTDAYLHRAHFGAVQLRFGVAATKKEKCQLTLGGENNNFS